MTNLSLKTFKIDHNDPIVFAVIDRIARDTKVVPFGYQTTEDIRQDIWLICINAIKEWQPEKITEDTKTFEQALEKFLRVVVPNRIVNRFKEITKTVKSPCPTCEYFNDSGSVLGNCKKFGDEKSKCSKFSRYTFSVASRNDLLNIIDEPEETNYSEEWAAELSTTDIVKNIKEKLDTNTKEDFDNVINGKNIPKKSLTRIREVTREIISQEKKNAE